MYFILNTTNVKLGEHVAHIISIQRFPRPCRRPRSTPDRKQTPPISGASSQESNTPTNKTTLDTCPDPSPISIVICLSQHLHTKWSDYINLCGCAQAAQGLNEGQCVKREIFWSCGVACCEHSRVIVKFPLRLEAS